MVGRGGYFGRMRRMVFESLVEMRHSVWIPAFGELCATSRYCLSAANFTPILTFPHRGGRDFQAPIRGYAKVSPVSWYGTGSSRE